MDLGLLKPSLQEWLETDGLGGFASSTTAGIHTRRYHGWLFLSGKDPGERWLALSKLEDVCKSPDGVWELSSNFYPGTTYPRGIDHLWAFAKDPFARFIFKVGKTFLEREIFMVRGVPGVFCRYKLKDGLKIAGREAITLSLRPLCNARFYHNISREGSWSPRIHRLGDAVLLDTHPAWGGLLLACCPGSFVEAPCWYRNMVYPRERERGLDYLEDHFSPGYFSAALYPGEEVVFYAGPVPKGPERFGEALFAGLEDTLAERLREMTLEDFTGTLRETALSLAEMERQRREEIFLSGGTGLLGKLFLAGDQFIVNVSGKSSIIAGYHWFGEWGRDSFISLPGLLLASGRFADAKEVFLRFSAAIEGGLVPNRFEEGRGAAYNSADASLWFIDALSRYEKISGDSGLVIALLPKVKAIVEAYMAGTSNGIRMDSDGLLCAGSRETQLTWMDACVDGMPVTPREGYPVEVNALWIQALDLLGNWCKRFGDTHAQASLPSPAFGTRGTPKGESRSRAEAWTETPLAPTGDLQPDSSKYFRIAHLARKEFLRRFVWPGVGLYDRVDCKGPVAEIRPNQVIAAALPGLDLPHQVLMEVWNTAVTKLLTPHGLRSLAPSSAGYAGTYKGGPRDRDRAYHQGTAWPWLFGPLFDLAGKISTGVPGFQSLREELFSVLLSHVSRLDANPCIGTIFEVASGDPPYEPDGAVAQAWSVAEVTKIISHFRGLEKDINA
ncbi:MAG: glycogen debranching enzyme N-terminal domain-containing protein [Candidatus Fermentithermobacillus carboniphilus]|uniref:Glycogen debranching enzyme N-terminal domain-containing protein n=1 Tax=Candidatus Fermentithermobacillus carboniphilus TaxID=3085328 RepID=A0AAT9LBE5_9FIRM|nr:MAG: glycogen debranching enzyme N-terminal domain-containing protein [Candidatus Fermentithermobacillus carboniphilus]